MERLKKQSLTKTVIKASRAIAEQISTDLLQYKQIRRKETEHGFKLLAPLQVESGEVKNCAIFIYQNIDGRESIEYDNRFITL